MEYGADKTLKSYSIVNLSTLFIVLRLQGGWNPLLACSLKKAVLQPLAGYIRVVTDEPDMISLEDEPSQRAKMPCGHVIGEHNTTAWQPWQLTMSPCSVLLRRHGDW